MIGHGGGGGGGERCQNAQKHFIIKENIRNLFCKSL